MPVPTIHVAALETRQRAGVVDLYRTCFPGAARRPRDEVDRKLGQLFFDGPLCDARLPSLVACTDDGAVVGFRGRVRRGWRCGDERLLGSTTSGLMVSPALRRAGVSTALRAASRRVEEESGVRSALDFADRSTGDGRAFGRHGRVVFLQPFGFDWSLPLRPGRLRAVRAAEWRLPESAPRRWLLRALTPAPKASAAPAGVRTLPLSAAALQEAVEAAGEGRALRIDEPRDVWEWLLAYLADYPSRGRFSGRVLLGEAGRPLGFHAGYGSAGHYEVLGFAAAPGAHAAVVDALAREAHDAGALLATGSAHAHELRAFLARGARIDAGSPVGVTTLRPELLQRFAALDVLLNGLEGERWL